MYLSIISSTTIDLPTYLHHLVMHTYRCQYISRSCLFSPGNKQKPTLLTVYTLKRNSNWPLSLVTCIVHTDLSINGGKKRFHVQNCPCGTVDAKIRYVLGLRVHDKVVVELGRKVFTVDCLL